MDDKRHECESCGAVADCRLDSDWYCGPCFEVATRDAPPGTYLSIPDRMGPQAVAGDKMKLRGRVVERIDVESVEILPDGIMGLRGRVVLVRDERGRTIGSAEISDDGTCVATVEKGSIPFPRGMGCSISGEQMEHFRAMALRGRDVSARHISITGQKQTVAQEVRCARCSEWPSFGEGWRCPWCRPEVASDG